MHMSGNLVNFDVVSYGQVHGLYAVSILAQSHFVFWYFMLINMVV